MATKKSADDAPKTRQPANDNHAKEPYPTGEPYHAPTPGVPQNAPPPAEEE